MSKSFKNGVHPFEGKEFSKDVAIQKIDADSIMAYPLSQHIGAPATPVVQKGDAVLKGQLIAEASAFISASIYSSVSGTVKGIEKRTLVNGNVVDSIIIENDGLYNAVEGFGVERDADALSREEMLEAIKNAGVVGLGGAGFPTHVKLAPKNVEGIDTLIINGAECEPYLTSDYRIMLERGKEVVRGAELALKLFPNAKVVFAIEKNKPEAIKAMQELVANKEKMSVCPLKTKYPQGGERQIIYAITGRKLNMKMLPADKGVIVMNIATTYAVYEALCLNMPVVHKVMTISGEGANSPCNVDVPVGVSHAYVLEKAGGASDKVVKFISGGPMMGFAMSTLESPVVKASSSILAFEIDDVAQMPQTVCIHCGKCVKACPQFLVPQMMAKEVDKENFEGFSKLGGLECIECGCCTYGCPAKIPLTQKFRYGKLKVREELAKRAKEGN